MDKPLISFIVAIYNVEKYIINCIDSIIEQTYKNIEIVLVDDGSKDSSGTICDNYAKQDDRIKIVHTSNGGLSSARNVGIENAIGEFFIFIDGDDSISPEMTEIFYESALKYNADIVIGGRYNVFEDKPKETVIFYTEEGVLGKNIVMQDLLEDNLSSHTWGKMYKAFLWKNIRFILGRVYGEDIATMHLIYDRTETIVSIPLPLYNYRINNASLTTTYRPFKWMSTYLAFKERLEFADAYYPAMTTKLRSMTINFARLTLDNYLQRHEECDKEYVPEIIERLHSNNKFILKTPYLKWYNKILIFYYNLFPSVYAKSIRFIHKVFYNFNPNKFR